MSQIVTTSLKGGGRSEPSMKDQETIRILDELEPGDRIMVQVQVKGGAQTVECRFAGFLKRSIMCRSIQKRGFVAMSFPLREVVSVRRVEERSRR